MGRVHKERRTKNGVLPASNYFIFSTILFMNLVPRFQPGNIFYKCQCLAHSIFILQCIILFVVLNFLFIIFICLITFRAKTFFTSCKCLSISECYCHQYKKHLEVIISAKNISGKFLGCNVTRKYHMSNVFESYLLKTTNFYRQGDATFFSFLIFLFRILSSITYETVKSQG